MLFFGFEKSTRESIFGACIFREYNLARVCVAGDGSRIAKGDEWNFKSEGGWILEKYHLF